MRPRVTLYTCNNVQAQLKRNKHENDRIIRLIPNSFLMKPQRSVSA